MIKKIKNYIRFHYIENKRKKFIKVLKKKEKVKIVFLGYALGASCDIFSNIYKYFNKDSRFDPYIVIVPNTYGSKEDMVQLQNEAKEYLNKLKLPYIEGYNEKKAIYFDIQKELNPDIVFMCHHYDWFRPEFRINNFLEKIVYITPYSYFLDDNLVNNANTYAYYFAHHCFFESKELTELWKNNSLNKKNKTGEFLGYLKIDDLLFNNEKSLDLWKIKNKKIKRIIWAPHHLDAPLSNFLEYKDLFLNLAKNNKNIQIAFRPHPGLRGSLSRVALWDQKKIDEYYNTWKNLPNTFISEGPFKDLFFTSDAMILDSISFIAEYILTNKPMLVQAPKLTNFSFNAVGVKLRNSAYQASSWNDIVSFINNVVINENDTMYNTRQRIKNNELIPSNNKLAANNIYHYICNEIFKEN